MVSAIDARAGQRVLDVATGTGMVAAALVRRYGVDVVGIDQSPQMLAGARARLARSPALAEHVTLREGDAQALPFGDGEFDHLTFTYLLRYVEDPAATMRELGRVWHPGDGSRCSNSASRRASRGTRCGARTRALGCPRSGGCCRRSGRTSGASWRSASRTSTPPPLATLAPMWEAAGIVDVRTRVMSFGAGVVMWGRRDGASRPTG